MLNFFSNVEVSIGCSIGIWWCLEDGIVLGWICIVVCCVDRIGFCPVGYEFLGAVGNLWTVVPQMLSVGKSW